MHEWLPYASVAIALAALLLTWLNNARSVPASKLAELKVAHAQEVTGQFARHEQLAMRIDHVEDRMTKCEGQVLHLPDKDVTHRLELGLADMRSEIRVLGEQMKPVAAIAARIQEGMLEKAFK